MPKKSTSRPTVAELEILAVLWDLGPSTVREAWEVINARRPTGYTTVLKFLQIMHGKGHVTRDASMRSHRYTPVASAEETRARLVEDLAQRAFGGQLHMLAESLVDIASPTEIKKIKGAVAAGKKPKASKAKARK
jgi:BlaI family transcriptional regulator, penicillinase repressor